MVWKPDTVEEAPGERSFAGSDVLLRTRHPEYLLDGQQRLTSLRAVKTNQLDLWFHLTGDEHSGPWVRKASAKTTKDPEWCSLNALWNSADGLNLAERLPEHTEARRELVRERIWAAKAVLNQTIPVTVIQTDDFMLVADIFQRINSGGRPLNSVDLATSTLSARWAGGGAKLQEEARRWQHRDFAGFDVAFLVRALAADCSPSALARDLHKVPVTEIAASWERVRSGLAHLHGLLTRNLDIQCSTDIPSLLAAVPIVTWLGRRGPGGLPPTDADAALYWFLLAQVTRHYASSIDSVLAGDVAALREGANKHGHYGLASLRNLYARLSTGGAGLAVSVTDLDGQNRASAHALLLRLAIQQRGARDWHFGTNGQTLFGNQRAEAHHIHPRATLKGRVSPARLQDDLANITFISAQANKHISKSSPVEYFPRVGDEQLAAHLIPTDLRLRRAERYTDFLAARRQLLSEAMTAYLEQFRPAWCPQPGAAEALQLRSARDSNAAALVEGHPGNLPDVRTARAWLDAAEVRLTRLLQEAEEARKRLRGDTTTASVVAQREATQLRIATLRAAEQALADGDYGLCSSCGDPITWERMEEFPHSTTCLACARGAQE
jgi:RNA polymerase-binding transcription factor DksA